MKEDTNRIIDDNYNGGMGKKNCRVIIKVTDGQLEQIDIEGSKTVIAASLATVVKSLLDDGMDAKLLKEILEFPFEYCKKNN